MTVQEFSDAFDTLLNSYNTQANFGEGASKAEIALDEYEKSVLLTQAQDLIVKSYFYGNQNAQGQGFDDSTRRQVDFSSLIKTAILEEAEDQSSVFDDRGIIYQLPAKVIDSEPVENTTDVLFILNEKLIVKENAEAKKGVNYVVVPLNYKEYDREMSKVYSQPFKKQAWRLFQNQSTEFDVQSELIPIWNISEELTKDSPSIIAVYKIRYVKRPDPIVLVKLPDGLTIDGVSEVSECTLNPILHMDILNKAVELAIATRGYNSQRVREANERA